MSCRGARLPVSSGLDVERLSLLRVVEGVWVTTVVRLAEAIEIGVGGASTADTGSGAVPCDG